MKPKVIVIAGPTASGKTSLAIKLAKELNGEIISADSMQIYKEMNIGTAKPTEEEKEGIPHYMIDIVEPNENFNVAKYKEMAEEKIRDIISRKKYPIIVGGTGLYIDTLVNGIEFKEIERDEEYCKQLELEVANNGIDTIFEKLKEIDPESAKVIDKQNVRRVIRALEIYKVTGKTKTQLDKESIKGSEFEFLVFGLLWDREELYNRINIRVDQMIKLGLVEEVRNLMNDKGFSKTSLQGLGYKEVVDYLENKITYDEMIEKIKLETRRYAKRQMTWFRRNKNIIWLDAKNSKESYEKVLELIK